MVEEIRIINQRPEPVIQFLAGLLVGLRRQGQCDEVALIPPPPSRIPTFDRRQPGRFRAMLSA